MAHALSEYQRLLRDLTAGGYALGPVRAYFRQTFAPPFVFLRHDVDRLVSRAVGMAEAEAELGVASTYYFRCTAAGDFPSPAIGRVHDLGHEIGFHYETVTRAGGDMRRATAAFRAALEGLRRLAPVETVAAHGSPLARDSNMDLPERFEFGELGLLGDPSADFDFSTVLYVTDTGGTFGSSSNLRDRVAGRQLFTPTDPATLGRRLRPPEEPLVLLNCHPERWPSSLPGLLQARVTDRLANLAKQAVAKARAAAPREPRRRNA